MAWPQIGLGVVYYCAYVCKLRGHAVDLVLEDPRAFPVMYYAAICSAQGIQSLDA